VKTVVFDEITIPLNIPALNLKTWKWKWLKCRRIWLHWFLLSTVRKHNQ